MHLNFRNQDMGRAFIQRLAQVVAQVETLPLAIMHVCGSHEQAIARFGLRSALPPGLSVIPGPGCPVCITDRPEIDAAIHLAESGIRVVTYGDMMRVPGSRGSLADARARGAMVDVAFAATDVLRIAEEHDGDVVFFATGFETTAVATAALVVAGLPTNLSIYSAHKYIPPAMEIVAEMPETRIRGYLAAGHAATITGFGIFEAFCARHRVPVVVAGFEPLDILAGIVRLVELVRDGRNEVDNMFPRCVTREGNRRAQEVLWQVFRPTGAPWRGIAHVPNGNLRLQPTYAGLDATVRFAGRLAEIADDELAPTSDACICGDIMAGLRLPPACTLYGRDCTPDRPVGACMVSTEGTCRIWHEYGEQPTLLVAPLRDDP